MKEEILEKIREFRSTRDKKAFTQYFTQNEHRLEILLESIWKLENYPYKEYASWMFFHIVRTHPESYQSYYNNLVDVLFKTDDQSVLRNVVNCIQTLKITEYRESEFIDLLISFIQNHENKVALQVYSIAILIQFCEKYPELSSEIEQIIELNNEGKTAAYKVANRKFKTFMKKK